MAKSSFEMVAEFHDAFGQPIGKEPLIPTADRVKLRLSLILEEVAELADAMGYEGDILRDATTELFDIGVVKEHDLIGAADAMGDTEYVINGCAIEYGFDLPNVVEEIHRSNMTKLGSDGKPIYREDGKILKGEAYEKPNLERVMFS